MNKEIKLSTTKLDPIPKNFKLFYCTFGYGQENSGCVQPIYAKSINDAHKIMCELYGGQWCWAYTDKEFNSDKFIFDYKKLPVIYSTKI